MPAWARVSAAQAPEGPPPITPTRRGLSRAWPSLIAWATCNKQQPSPRQSLPWSFADWGCVSGCDSQRQAAPRHQPVAPALTRR